MKRYLKLVNFEFNRIANVYWVFLGIILIAQVVAVVMTANDYMNKADEAINEQMLTQNEFLNETGPLAFQSVVQSVWFMGPVVLGIALVAFYIFLIWYRDWVGKNTFAYRLLTLPTTRLNLFYAKLTTILLMTFGFVAFQYIIYPLEKLIMQWMVPVYFRVDASFHEVIDSLFLGLNYLYPGSLTLFGLRYGTGIVIVAVLFTCVLFERSYRWKGIVLGVLYGVLAGVVFLLPLILYSTVFFNDLFPSEMIMLSILSGLIVLIGSIVMSGYLLNKKIRV